MTEDQAKTKWCPFARVGSEREKGSGWNRPEMETFGHREKIGGENHCIGSACMAWRWGGPKTVPSISAIAGEMKEAGIGPLDAVGAVHQKVPDGFCGLAGSPQ